jgi:hypothetical protein
MKFTLSKVEPSDSGVVLTATREKFLDHNGEPHVIETAISKEQLDQMFPAVAESNKALASDVATLKAEVATLKAQSDSLHQAMAGIKGSE